MNPRPRKVVIAAADDKLYAPEVGPWAEDKYRLFWCYADLFATSMKDRWHQRVYIDLFAGAGLARVAETDHFLLGTPLLALRATHPFDWYVFCDKDPNCLSALQRRVEALRPGAEVRYLSGDVNQMTPRLVEDLPPLAAGKRVLAFCFADPFRLRDLHFTTIRVLAQRYIDFMVLIPGMDPRRNETTYLDPSSDVVDLFVGTPAWREDWERRQRSITFDTFVATFSLPRWAVLVIFMEASRIASSCAQQIRIFLYIDLGSTVGMSSGADFGKRLEGTAKISSVFSERTGAHGTVVPHRVD